MGQYMFIQVGNIRRNFLPFDFLMNLTLPPSHPPPKKSLLKKAQYSFTSGLPKCLSLKAYWRNQGSRPMDCGRELTLPFPKIRKRGVAKAVSQSTHNHWHQARESARLRANMRSRSGATSTYQGPQRSLPWRRMSAARAGAELWAPPLTRHRWRGNPTQTTDCRQTSGLHLAWSCGGGGEDAAERCARAEAVALVSLARRLRVGVCRPIVAGIALVETIRKTGSSERSGSRKRETEDETWDWKQLLVWGTNFQS